MDCSHQALLSMRFFQARILEWVDLPKTGIEPTSLVSPASAGVFFTTSTSWEAHQLNATVAKSQE